MALAFDKYCTLTYDIVLNGYQDKGLASGILFYTSI